MRFPRIGSRMTQNGSQNDLRMTLQTTLPDWSRDGPQIDLPTLRSALSHMAVSNNTVFKVLLTIAEVKDLSSQDWIRPPTRCQL